MKLVKRLREVIAALGVLLAFPIMVAISGDDLE